MSGDRGYSTEGTENSSWTARVLAIAEPLFLIAALSIAASALAPQLGIPTRAERDALLYGGAPQFLAAAVIEALWLGFRYGLTFSVIIAVCWWRRGPGWRAAGISTGGHSVGQLILFGAVTCLIVMALNRAVWAVHLVHPLGQETPFWELSRQAGWTFEFWVYLAASSYLLVPVIEELFFRGYAQSRFREAFSAGGAVVLSSIVFWVSHGQYLAADPFLLFTSIYVLFGSLALGWMTAKTGSLIPAIVMHMMLNVPGNAIFNAGWAVLAVAVGIVLRKRIAAEARDFAALIASTREWLFLGGAGVVLFGLATLIRADATARVVVIGLVALLFLASLVMRRKPVPA